MAQRDVWIDAEDCLRQKLSSDEDYACRYDGLAHKYQRLVVAHHAFYDLRAAEAHRRKDLFWRR